MSVCGCGLPACCCQPAVADSFIYADLRSELNTHLAPAGFVYSEFSWARLPLLQAFPFPSTLREVTLNMLSQDSGKWVFPYLLWSFPPTATFTSFPAPCCWVCAATPAFSSQAWLVYLQFCEDLPLPLSSALSAPRPLCYVSFLLLLVIQFLFFPWVGGLSVQGVMLIWPRVVYGSTVCHLAHLVVCFFPSRLDASIWWRHGSLLCAGWRCGRVKILPFLSGFSCKVYL
jgi:hypothetical protein